jgi:hypothetical protein
MIAVDVHGATVDAPIFAEPVSAFTILGADGKETIINKQSKDRHRALPRASPRRRRRQQVRNLIGRLRHVASPCRRGVES